MGYTKKSSKTHSNQSISRKINSSKAGIVVSNVDCSSSSFIPTDRNNITCNNYKNAKAPSLVNHSSIASCHIIPKPQESMKSKNLASIMKYQTNLVPQSKPLFTRNASGIVTHRSVGSQAPDSREKSTQTDSCTRDISLINHRHATGQNSNILCNALGSKLNRTDSTRSLLTKKDILQKSSTVTIFAQVHNSQNGQNGKYEQEKLPKTNRSQNKDKFQQDNFKRPQNGFELRLKKLEELEESLKSFSNPIREQRTVSHKDSASYIVQSSNQLYKNTDSGGYISSMMFPVDPLKASSRQFSSSSLSDLSLSKTGTLLLKAVDEPDPKARCQTRVKSHTSEPLIKSNKDFDKKKKHKIDGEKPTVFQSSSTDNGRFVNYHTPPSNCILSTQSVRQQSSITMKSTFLRDLQHSQHNNHQPLTSISSFTYLRPKKILNLRYKKKIILTSTTCTSIKHQHIKSDTSQSTRASSVFVLKSGGNNTSIPNPISSVTRLVKLLESNMCLHGHKCQFYNFNEKITNTLQQQQSQRSFKQKITVPGTRLYYSDQLTQGDVSQWQRYLKPRTPDPGKRRSFFSIQF